MRQARPLTISIRELAQIVKSTVASRQINRPIVNSSNRKIR
jgi:hypothetical protein